jgi:hypothetical protein
LSWKFFVWSNERRKRRIGVIWVYINIKLSGIQAEFYHLI